MRYLVTLACVVVMMLSIARGKYEYTLIAMLMIGLATVVDDISEW